MSIATHITGIQHVGIPTNDLLSTISFFESLGFSVLLCTGTQEEPVAFLEQKGLNSETSQTGQADGLPGALDHIAIDVDDIDQAYQEITALGLKPLEGMIKELPFWERGVRFFTIAGPNGEKIEFSQKL